MHTCLHDSGPNEYATGRLNGRGGEWLGRYADLDMMIKELIRFRVLTVSESIPNSTFF